MVAVLKTKSELAIPAPIGALLLVAVKGILGINKPLLLLGAASISNKAEALGAAPVVLIPAL